MFAQVLTYAAWGFGLFCIWMFFRSIRLIPNNRVAIKETKLGHRLKEGQFIALKGEAGYQPEVLRGGFHLLNPFFDEAHQTSMVTISQGQIGYVFARDGASMSPVQTLARVVPCNDFQDVRAFLVNGGQRGLQRAILREGQYAINLAQFVIITEEQIYMHSLARGDDKTYDEMARQISEMDGFRPVLLAGDQVGVITVQDGPSLEADEIIAPVVGNINDAEHFHNNFQDPEAFLRAGGRRGRQLQVLVEGTYYINRRFATVEAVPKTVIEVGTAGVVVSYTGRKGEDVTGDTYKHGELVERGCRGVWKEPLLPGKYAINTYAMKVVAVPTTNFILKWVRTAIGAHRFDENLQEVSLITKDAFEPSLPLSVVVHIDYKLAPRVIQRFGDIKRLVEQTLDPMVSAYFKNVGQTRTLIQLLQDRTEIQALASQDMREKFQNYDLELEEVLIGTPAPSDGDHRIEDILTQLRMRQIAEEQIVTYSQQEKAAKQERELREAEARARQQQQITESELAIQVQSNEGKASYQKALQEADKIRAIAEAEAQKTRSMAQAQADNNRVLAEAEAGKIRALGDAEAERTLKVGHAEAQVAEEKVRAYGGPRYQLTQQVMNRFAEAVEKSGVDLVPRVVLSGGQGNGGPGSANVMEGLMAMLLSEKMGIAINDEPAPKPVNGLVNQ